MKLTSLILLISFPVIVSAQWNYPAARKVDTTTNYHGTMVADPYRWLEDDRSAETAAWVEAQNKVTYAYLDQIPYRKQWLEKLEAISNYPRYSAPIRKGEYYYFSKNDGLQNQSVLYRQKGQSGTPEKVLDPNGFSADGTTGLATFSLSKDGRYAVVGKTQGGSDWRTFHVMDMRTLSYLPDSISWVKVSGASWKGNGFFYSRYPQPEKGKELSTKNENHQVYYHTLGTGQSEDRLVFEDKAHSQRFHSVFTSEDERYVFLGISDRGTGKIGNALWYYDSREPGTAFRPLIAEAGNYSYDVIDVIDGRALILTNDGADNNRVISMDLKNPDSKNWKTLIAERPENITGANAAGGKLFLTYLKDVTSRVNVFSLKGKFENEIVLPGPGTVGGFAGEAEDQSVFYLFTSMTFPPTIFRYDIPSRSSALFRKSDLSFNPDAYQTTQVFYPSKDGTRIPMFITFKKGLQFNGRNPTILYGYGGFNLSSNPSFSSSRITWLEQGGVFCIANIRGGSEYGEKWHEAGMGLRKQNVFDDFIAAAEYLAKEGYASADYLALQGGSNGGLLVGTVINQRPEICKVAIPQVGVMDMLRFQKFTIGFNWIAEYGSSDNLSDFPNLYAYSPLHNIKRGKNYPAVMITTADHDDRVVPAHSFKYAATLQEAYQGKNPILIRIDTRSGHGASNLRKSLEATADIYAFILWNMGVKPKF